MKNKVEMSNSIVTFERSNLYPCELGVFRDYDCVLESGYKLKDFKIAFQTYGKLNEQKLNAILICHALTADQFVLEKHPITNKESESVCLAILLHDIGHCPFSHALEKSIVENIVSKIFWSDGFSCL